MKGFLSKLRKELVIAVFVAVIVLYLIDPIVKLIGSSVFDISGKIFKSYNDSLFQRIAQRQENLESGVFLLILLLFVSLIFSAIAFVWYKEQKSRMEIENLLKSIDEGEGQSERQKTTAELREEIVRTQKDLRRSTRIYKSMTIISALVFLVSMVVSFSTELMVKEKIDLFDNSLAIVSPYISDLDYKKAQSQFHLVKSSEDFDRVLSTISAEAERNGIVLFWRNK